MLKQNMSGRNKALKVVPVAVNKQCIHNHLTCSYVLGDKKALVRTMAQFYSQEGGDVFNKLPLTFHLTEGL